MVQTRNGEVSSTIEDGTWRSGVRGGLSEFSKSIVSGGAKIEVEIKTKRNANSMC